jgi:polyhydroxyalkanoate synthesis regulator phasin
MNSKLPLMFVAAALLVPWTALAGGEDLEALRQDTINLIQELTQSGALGRENAAALLRDLKQPGAAPIVASAAPAPGKWAEVPDLSETARNKIKEELRQEILAQAREEGLSLAAARNEIKEELRKEMMAKARDDTLPLTVRNEIKEELRKEVMAQAKAEGWAPTSVPANLVEANQTAINLVQALVQSGILSQDKADALVREAKRSAAETVATQTSGSKVVRVPYVPVTVRNEIKEELRKEVMAQAKDEGWAAPASVPGWLEGMKWEGDFRLRAQQDRFATDNFTPLQLGLVEDPINIGNSQDNNNRLRLRLRFGVETQLSAMTSVGFRLATGSVTNNPLSTNQTLGNNFDRYAVGVDRAYIKLHPASWLNLAGGRIANPFFSTDLVWHPDLNFDGAVATVKPKFSESGSGFLTMGAFPLTKLDPNPNSSTQSRWLYGGQAGVDWKVRATGMKLGLALYDYRHVEGIPNTGDYAINPITASMNDSTAPQYRQKGNSLVQLQAINNPTLLYGLASKFREWNLTGSLDFAQLDPVHVVLTGDYVKNIGFDRAEIFQRTGRNLDPKTLGYQARLTVGNAEMRKRRDWQVFAAYKYLERDAVLDAYTDSDFRLGGTDSKGYIFGINYGIDKNTWLGFKWLSADPINGPPLKIDVLQLDLNSRF